MKKTCLWLAIVAAIVLAFDFSAGIFIRQIIGKSGFRFARLYSKNPINANVVVFGNSRSVNAFDTDAMTKATGLRWMNFGYNGLGPALVEALVYDYLDRNQKPDLIILEVSNLWQGLGPIRDLRLFSSCSSRLADLDSDNSALTSIAKHGHLYVCNGELIFRLVNYFGKSDQNWVNGGTLRQGDADAAILKASESLRAGVPRENIETYQRLIQDLERRGIPYRLVITPYLLNDDGVQRLCEAVGEIGKDGKVLNHIAAVSDVACFADPLHLNAKGRSVYCDILTASFRDKAKNFHQHCTMPN